MRRKFTHIIKKLRSIPRTSLRENEHAVMRSDVLAVIRSESVPAAERRSMREKETGRPAVPVLPAIINRLKTMPAVIITLIVLLSGSTSLAAEGALPGDLLYPVKVNINEEVRAAFTFGAEADAAWEAERALRRLREAEELATRMRLSAESRADIEHRFEAHTDSVENDTMRLDAAGAARVRTKFQSELAAHERTLMELRSQGEQELDAVLETVGGARIRIQSSTTIKAGSETRTESDMNDETVPNRQGANSDANIRTETDTGVDVDTDLLDTETDIRTNTETRIGL